MQTSCLVFILVYRSYSAYVRRKSISRNASTLSACDTDICGDEQGNETHVKVAANKLSPLQNYVMNCSIREIISLR